jgi:hypothetical protein
MVELAARRSLDLNLFWLYRLGLLSGIRGWGRLRRGQLYGQLLLGLAFPFLRFGYVSPVFRL